MTKLIDKSALVAEIDRLITELVEEGKDTMFEQGRISAFEDVKVFINHTLEAKEINNIWYDTRRTIPEDGSEQIICIKEDGLAVSTVGKIVNGTIKWAYLNDLLNISDVQVKEVEEEPVSRDLEEAADKHLVEKGYLLTANNGEHLAEVEAKGLFKAGAKWQKEQLIEKTCVFLESTDFYKYYNRKFVEEFKKAMEE